MLFMIEYPRKCFETKMSLCDVRVPLAFLNVKGRMYVPPNRFISFASSSRIAASRSSGVSPGSLVRRVSARSLPKRASICWATNWFPMPALMRL